MTPAVRFALRIAIVALWVVMAPVPGLADDESSDRDELQALANAIERHPFLAGVRGEPRSREVIYEADLQRLKKFLASASGPVEHWHWLYGAAATRLIPEGRQISAQVTGGVVFGIGLEMGVGIEDRALVRRPHLFLNVPYRFVNIDREYSFIGVSAACSSRYYRQRDRDPGECREDLTEKHMVPGLGLVVRDDVGPKVGETDWKRGLAVGAGGGLVNSANLLSVELPAWLWPLPSAERRLIRQLLLLEFDLIHHTQRLDLVRAEEILRRLRTRETQLRARLAHRLGGEVGDLALNPAHPLASVSSLFSQPAVRRYQGPALQRFFRRCAIRLDLGE